MENAITTQPTATQPTATTEAPVTPTPEVKTEAAAAVETKVEAPKEEDRLAAKFAALAKREKMLTQKEQQYKREIENLRKEAELAKKYQELKQKAKLDPDTWLKEAELDYDYITQHKLNGGKVTQETELSLLKKELEAIKQKEAEREQMLQAEKEKAAVQNYIKQIDEHVNATEKYELIKTYDYSNVVYNVIDQHYAETGSIMDLDEACELVEAHLEQQVEENTKKLSTTKKFATKLAQKTQEPKPAEKPTPTEAKTLTNTTETPPRLDVDLSPEERLKQAAKMINFNG